MRKGGKRMENLDDLYKWFDMNRDEIVKGHEGASVLLKDDAVISYFPNDDTGTRNDYAEQHWS